MEQNRNIQRTVTAPTPGSEPSRPTSVDAQRARPARDGVQPQEGLEGRGTLYQEITAKIIAELEAGRVPWVQPWHSAGMPAMPVNAGTDRRYSGINVLTLWAAAIERGYARQRWLTYRQALALGGSVRRGERATTVVYIDRFVPDDERRRASEAGEEVRATAFLKTFQVFNVDQCEGLAEEHRGRTREATPAPMEPWMDALILTMRVDVQVGSTRARYNWIADRIDVPSPSAYPDPINWYRTMLHELAHATGHRDRLARDLTGWFGSAQYAREELVAEMTAAFLCAALGVVPTVRHADYIGSWLEVLRADDRAIVRAASLASKAADYMLKFLPTEMRGNQAV